MNKRIFGIGVLVSIIFFCTASTTAASPLERVEKGVTQVLDVLRDPSLSRENQSERIWEIVQTLFDFNELSRRALGRDWRRLDSGQREEFTSAFSRLLSEVYMDRVLNYKDERVIFEGETVKSEKYAEVDTRVMTSKGPVPIIYRVVVKNSRWMIYDVVIEGVSLIRNYRSQFTEILRKKSPDDLIRLVKDKIREYR